MNLQEHKNKLTSRDLYDIAKWGLTGEYEYSGCWDDNEDNLEGAIECVVNDFKTFISEPYPHGLGDIPNNLIIFRLLRLKNIDDLDKINLGHSWFSNPQQIKKSEFYQMLPHLEPGNRQNSKVYLIRGKTNIDNVDIPRTLWERSTQYWENEIVIKDDTKIDFMGIKEITIKDKLNESSDKKLPKIIRTMIQTMGVDKTLKMVGNKESVIPYLTIEDKISYITEMVPKISEEFGGGYLNIYDLRKYPIQYPNQNVGQLSQIVHLNRYGVLVDVYNFINLEYDFIYDYKLDYESLPPKIINEIFNILIKHK